MTPRLHHVGQVVKDLDETRSRLARAFGYRIESEPIDDPVQKATVQFLRCPDAEFWLELISPLGIDSHLHKALGRRVALHHLCYEVADIESAGVHVVEAGYFQLAAPVPAVAFEGLRISWFLSPAHDLIELLEEGRAQLSLRSIRSVGQ